MNKGRVLSWKTPFLLGFQTVDSALNREELEELSGALQSMGCGKERGIAGIPVEISSGSPSVIGGDLLEAVNNRLSEGRLPPSRAVLISMTLRTGDLFHCYALITSCFQRP